MIKQRQVVAASVWISCLGGAFALAACGGDTVNETFASDAGGTTLPDATTGNQNDSGGVMSMTDATVVSDANTSGDDGSANEADAGDAGNASDAGLDAAAIYAGQSATVNANALLGTTVTTATWTLISAPTGSLVTTASLVNASSSTVTVPTDVAGLYVVALSGSATLRVTITALPAHVVYGVFLQTGVLNGPIGSFAVGDAGLAAVDNDGTHLHSIICPYVKQFAAVASSGALAYVDTFERAPGTDTLVAFASPPGAATLNVTTTAGSCPPSGDAGADAAVAYVPDAGAGASPGISHPRFSPDGTRIAFTFAPIYNSGATPDVVSTIEVVNVDGGSHASLGTIEADAGSTDTTSELQDFRQPEWADAGAVGWTRTLDAGAGSNGWAVVTSAVPPRASDPTLYMTCTLNAAGNGVPNRAVFLADGTVLVAAQASAQLTPTAVPTDLLVLTPDLTTKACAKTRNLSNPNNHSVGNVNAFAVSPDGTQVAFIASTTTSGGTLYTVPVAGGPLTQVGAAAQVDLVQGIRWVAGGSQLAFTYTNDGGVQTIASILASDAGTPKDLTLADSGTVTAVGSGDHAADCTMGRGRGNPAIGFFAGALALLGFARSRKRRQAG